LESRNLIDDGQHECIVVDQQCKTYPLSCHNVRLDLYPVYQQGCVFHSQKDLDKYQVWQAQSTTQLPLQTVDRKQTESLEHDDAIDHVTLQNDFEGLHLHVKEGSDGGHVPNRKYHFMYKRIAEIKVGSHATRQNQPAQNIHEHLLVDLILTPFDLLVH